MKALVVVLLIVNASLIVWQYDRHVASLTRDAMTRPPAPMDAPRLKLLSEGEELPEPRNPAPAPVAEASSEIKADVDAADLCIDVGPFAQVAVRARLRDFIDELTAAIHLRTVSVRKRQLFWVYLEPVPVGEAARSIADLERRGVKDFMLIRRGGLKNAISLGLFSSQDSVNRRLAELSEQGYQPVVVPRYETTDRFWLAAQFAAGHEDVPDIPHELLAGAAIEPVNCRELESAKPIVASGGL